MDKLMRLRSYSRLLKNTPVEDLEDQCGPWAEAYMNVSEKLPALIDLWEGSLFNQYGAVSKGNRLIQNALEKLADK